MTDRMSEQLIEKVPYNFFFIHSFYQSLIHYYLIIVDSLSTRGA
jgi:hypothetical protein